MSAAADASDARPPKSPELFKLAASHTPSWSAVAEKERLARIGKG
jgi:hypothetical protein